MSHRPNWNNFILRIFFQFFADYLKFGHGQMRADPKSNGIRNEFRFRWIVYVFNKVGMELQGDTPDTGDSRISCVGLSNANRIEHWNGTNCVSGEWSADRCCHIKIYVWFMRFEIHRMTLMIRTLMIRKLMNRKVMKLIRMDWKDMSKQRMGITMSIMSLKPNMEMYWIVRMTAKIRPADFSSKIPNEGTVG